MPCRFHGPLGTEIVHFDLLDLGTRGSLVLWSANELASCLEELVRGHAPSSKELRDFRSCVLLRHVLRLLEELACVVDLSVILKHVIV